MRVFIRLLLMVLAIPVLTAAVPAILAIVASYGTPVADPSPVRPLTPVRLAELQGAFHVHTRKSDGLGTESDIALAAQRAGLQFVVLTDHNLEEQAPPYFIDKVLLMPEVEISTSRGHLVALGLSRPLKPEERDEKAVDKVRELGGIPIIAHPIQERMPWSDMDAAARASGYELVSGDTLFRKALEKPWRLVGALGVYAVNPVQGLYALLKDDPETTQALLKLAGPKSPKTAFCGLDAHGFPSYESTFRAMRMHIPTASTLPADPIAAARQVEGALTDSRTYCAMDGLAPAPGFSIQGLNGFRATVGKTVHVVLPKEHPPVQVHVMGPAHLDPDERIIHLDGEGPVQVEILAKTHGLLLQATWKPWIVPSPFYVSASGI